MHHPTFRAHVQSLMEFLRHYTVDELQAAVGLAEEWRDVERVRTDRRAAERVQVQLEAEPLADRPVIVGGAAPALAVEKGEPVYTFTCACCHGPFVGGRGRLSAPDGTLCSHCTRRKARRETPRA